ncbi:hypothetical protein GGS23DRAFT_88248 [Durotheca rogersii]|uniref:uncharacterized protein n=1 Tax=Durotheca rogersii TaxID=419775 RepID=UPI002220DE9E|nr:uncharacterized protein GGS23DRAFT_88248 [Durotheca rogersii]KAI5862694.1 hypothetical protein GGS23DRAFT_88248 [Durotheca rogersii]
MHTMQARDATGRQVSLLNDDPYASHQSYHMPSHYPSACDQSPPPHTPELLRSDSYDSNASYDAYSPVTPQGLYDYSARQLYEDYLPADHQVPMKRPAYVVTSRSNSYEDDSSASSAAPEKVGKRYPCRYRESHGCEKTFTTSGHASRHSKIHTAEKAVQCTYPGCHKKFTRADNMKQHLETHFKDKSRSGSSTKSKSSSLSSTSKRSSVSSKSSSSSSSSSSPHSSVPSREVQMWESDPYGAEVQPLPSPGGAWDMRGLNIPLMGRPVAVRTSSGLDALAAIACQEGA